jgi:hypothetical protein
LEIKKTAVKKAKKRGRPPKNTVKKPKEPTFLETQVTQDADTSIAALDTNRSWGVKKNSRGHIDVRSTVRNRNVLLPTTHSPLPIMRLP